MGPGAQAQVRAGRNLRPAESKGTPLASLACALGVFVTRRPCSFDFRLVAPGRPTVRPCAPPLRVVGRPGPQIGVAFAGVLVLATGDGALPSGEYLAGFLIEKSLSLDNLFVFAVLMFSFLRRAPSKQPPPRARLRRRDGASSCADLHLAGAAALDARSTSPSTCFGALLLYTAVEDRPARATTVDPDKTPAMNSIRRVPMTEDYDGRQATDAGDGRGSRRRCSPSSL